MSVTDKIKARDIATSAPVVGQALVYQGENAPMTTAAVSGGSFSPSSIIAGATNLVVSQAQGGFVGFANLQRTMNQGGTFRFTGTGGGDPFQGRLFVNTILVAGPTPTGNSSTINYTVNQGDVVRFELGNGGGGNFTTPGVLEIRFDFNYGFMSSP